MFIKLRKYLSFKSKQKQLTVPEVPKRLGDTYTIQKNIEINEMNLKKFLGKSEDIVFREFEILTIKQTKVFICFINGLVNTQMVNECIVKPLIEDLPNDKYDNNGAHHDVIKTIKNRTLSVADLKEAQSMDQVIDAVLSGETALFIDGNHSAILISTQSFESRNVEEPETETVIRGPRDGFVETLQVNTALIRRKIKNPNLIFEKLILGRQTRTTICIGYIEGIANQKIIQEVKSRLNRIDTDSILESGYIEQFIEDHPFSLFSTIGNSENPDKVAAKLLEGRVAILCDGTPFVLTVPYLFIENMQVSEDYYSRPLFQSFSRLLRIVAFFIAILTPALYVALTTFHQEMIPTVLLTTMAASREGIPFPAFVEAVLMGVTFEILTEAGVRMPRPIGQAVTIVGALVVGEAAVQAGIVSSPMVIVMAVTGITGFVIPSLREFTVIFRFILIALAAMFGVFGILIGFFFLLGHLCSLRSFGSPYLDPIAPVMWNGLKDSFIRAPLWMLKSRPRSITRRDSKRQGLFVKPGPENPTQSGEEN